MSRVALLTSLITTSVLVVVAAGLLWWTPTEQPRQDGPLLDLNLSRVESLRVHRPDAEAVEIVERRDGGGWRLRIENAADAGAPAPWPVLATRARGALRVLANLAPRGRPDVEDSAPEEALRVEIHLSGGERRSLRIGVESLGGRRLAQIDGEAVYLDDSVYEMFTRPGPRGWRDPTAMPGVGAETSRVSLRTPQRDIDLARVEGTWHLRRPLRARASHAAVKRLTDTLASIEVERFLDLGGALPAEDAGLTEPTLIIEAEADRRIVDESGEVRTEVQRRTLRIGGPANLGGESRFAQPGGSPAPVIVSGEQIEQIDTEPLNYAARTASDESPADVGMIVLRDADGRERGFRRSLDGWKRIAEDGGLSATRPEPVNDLLSFLTDRLADRLEPSPLDEAESAGVIRLLDLNDGLLQSIEVAALPDGAIGLRGESLLRIYARGEPPEPLRWMIRPERGQDQSSAEQASASASAAPAEPVK